MKIQLNFDTKVIKVEDNVNLGELIEKLQAMLPEWKTWKLETNVTINWTSPVVIKEKVWPWNQPYWTTEPLHPLTINCSTGIHNIEI